MVEQEFTGSFRRLHRAVLGVANVMSTPDTPLRRWLSPVYTSLLYGLSGGRGLEGEINGETYHVDPRFRWRVQPDYEAELAAFLRARVRPGFCCIDVGANIGIYVMQLARWASPGGRVIAFEPNPNSFEVLQRHVRMNHREDCVTLVPLAAGRHAGTAQLFDTEPGSGLSRLGSANPGIVSSVTPTEVQLTTIDEYCTRFGLRPDLLLVDVEGFEFDVLAGAVETIRRARPAVVLELHPHMYPEGDASRVAGARLIADLGLRPVAIDGSGRDPWTTGMVSLEPA